MIETDTTVKNDVLRLIVRILDELFDSSMVNENDARLGDLIYQLECFIQSSDTTARKQDA